MMSTDQRNGRESIFTEGESLRLAATLLLAGQVIFILVTQLQTGGDANHHSSIFVKYAESGSWVGVHALQFGATALMVAGLVVLSFALAARSRGPAWAARMGAALAVVSLAMYGVLQAVDGIGNKQVDHAWANAPEGEEAIRFASAEAMRWLEWGVSSYHAYALGLSLLLFAVAAAAVQAGTIPRAIPFLIGLAGIAYIAKGWVGGTDGFNGNHSTLIVLTWVFSLAWMIWLVVITWRGRQTSELQPGGSSLSGGVG